MFKLLPAQLIIGQITGGQIAPGSIGTTQIAPGSITTPLLAANAVTAAKIAANTITGAQIAASVSLTSPVITGGTITGANIVADGGSGEFLAYSAAPALGNIVAAASSANGTDSFGNPFPAGIGSVSYNSGAGVAIAVTLYNTEQAFQRFSAGNWGLVAFINISGSTSDHNLYIGTGTAGSFVQVQSPLQVKGVFAGDTTLYDCERKGLVTTGSQSITSTTPATITGLSVGVSPGTYLVRGVIQCQQGTVAVSQLLGFSGPATSQCRIMTNFVLDGTGNTVNCGNMSSLTTKGSPSFGATNSFYFYFDGMVTFTAAGTFAAVAAEGTAGDTFSTIIGSHMSIEPVLS